jgi:5-methylcytosine-specific restriction endonuclease McrA
VITKCKTGRHARCSGDHGPTPSNLIPFWDEVRKGKMSPSSTSRQCLDCSRRATTGKYCEDHKTKNNASESRRENDAFRNQDSVRKLYKSSRWQVTRFLVLQHDILCRSCGNQAATQVDHVILARIVLDELGLDEFFNPKRCQGLCASCHSTKTAIECGWAGNGETAITAVDLGSDCANIVVVCGLPGSGKTHYVAEHRSLDDLVWDWDAEMSADTGQDIYSNTLTSALLSMLAQRDSFVNQARWSNGRAWVIIARRDAALTKLLEGAGASVVVCEVEESIRLQRLAERPPANA